MEKKNCVVCGKELKGQQKKYCSVNCKQKDFYRNYGGKSNASFRQFIKCVKRKLEFIELKGGKCEICGYDKNISALEFHHIDSSTKKFNLDARALANTKYEKILEELDKCKLVCSNCHKELHYENHDIKIIKKIIEENKNIIKKEKEIKYCKECGKTLLVENTSGFCRICLAKQKRKVERPTKEELKEMIKTLSLNKIGKNFGVTHNSVKKWLISYGIWDKNVKKY